MVSYYTRKQVRLELIDAVASNLGIDDPLELSLEKRIISDLKMNEMDLLQLAYDIERLFAIPESDLNAVIQKARKNGYQPCVLERPDFKLREIHQYICSRFNLESSMA